MRRKRAQGRRVLTVLLVLLFIWLLFEGRFYIPKHVRPAGGIQPVELELKTTAYCHCRKCCSYKWLLLLPYQKTGFLRYRFKHVGKTSSGAMVRPGTIAADTSIFPYGTVMYVPGYGYGRVEDTGGAVKGLHIDLYRPNHWFARQWGVQMKRVKIWPPAGMEDWSFDPSGLQDEAVTNKPAPVDEARAESQPVDAVVPPVTNTSTASNHAEQAEAQDED